MLFLTASRFTNILCALALLATTQPAVAETQSAARLYGGLTTNSASASIYEMAPMQPRSSPRMTALQAREDSILSTPAQFQMNAADLSKLAEHHVVIIVDRSASMNSRDCPGDLTRWEWCCRQASNLARELSRISSDGICVVPFNGSFQIFDHQNAADVVRIFDELHPSGQTKLAPPLRSQLVTQLARQWGGGKARPLLIAVITDGNVKDAPAVRKAIGETMAKLHSQQEIKIVFLRVGDDDRTNDCLFDYATGAPFRIVESARFEDVVYFGLGKRLAQALFH